MRKRLPAQRDGITRVEVLVVTAILAIMGALVTHGTQVARETSFRIKCVDNLRSLGIASHTFHDLAGHLPSEVPGFGCPEGLFSALGAFMICCEPEQGPDHRAYGFFLCPSRHTAIVGAYTDYGYHLTGDLMYDPVFLSGFGLPWTQEELTGQDGTAYIILLSHVGMKSSAYNDPAGTLKKWYQGPHYVADGSGGFLQDSEKLPTGAIASPHPGAVPTLFADAHVANLPIAVWGKSGLANAAWGCNDGNKNLPPWP